MYDPQRPVRVAVPNKGTEIVMMKRTVYALVMGEEWSDWWFEWRREWNSNL